MQTTPNHGNNVSNNSPNLNTATIHPIYYNRDLIKIVDKKINWNDISTNHVNAIK